MDEQITLKFLAGLAVIVLTGLALRPKKSKQDVDPAITQADAGERHDWRYVRWCMRAMQLLFSIYMFWSVVRFILA